MIFYWNLTDNHCCHKKRCTFFFRLGVPAFGPKPIWQGQKSKNPGPFCRACCTSKPLLQGHVLNIKSLLQGLASIFHFFPDTTWDQDLAFDLAPFLAAAEAWGVGQAAASSALTSTSELLPELLELLLLLVLSCSFLALSPGRKCELDRWWFPNRKDEHQQCLSNPPAALLVAVASPWCPVVAGAYIHQLCLGTQKVKQKYSPWPLSWGAGCCGPPAKTTKATSYEINM